MNKDLKTAKKFGWGSESWLARQGRTLSRYRQFCYDISKASKHPLLPEDASDEEIDQFAFPPALLGFPDKWAHIKFLLKRFFLVRAQSAAPRSTAEVVKGLVTLSRVRQDLDAWVKRIYGLRKDGKLITPRFSQVDDHLRLTYSPRVTTGYVCAGRIHCSYHGSTRSQYENTKVTHQ